MEEKRFNVVFSGKLTPGSKPPEVLNGLIQVLGMEEARVRELFKPGAGAIIGKDLNGSAAYSLRDDLQRAGVLCTVDETAAAPTIPRTPPAGQSRPDPVRRPPEIRPVSQVPAAPPRGEGGGIFGVVLKVILVAAVGYGGWWAYQTWFAPPTPAFTAYASYAEAMARGQYQKAVDESLGGARDHAESWVQMSRPTPMRVYGREYSSTPPSVISIAGDIAWIKRKRKMEEKKSDTAVALQVEETVCRIPPGVSSAVCKWPVTFQHDVEVHLVDGAWKVSEFKETRLTPQDK